MISSQLLPGLVAAVTFLPLVAPRSSEPRVQEEGPKKRFEPAVKLPDDFVSLARVPEGGTGPRVEAVADGHVVLYFKGNEHQGDLFLTRTKDEAKTFETSLQVDPEHGSVLAQEVGDSGSLDVGPDGRAHVLWISGGEKPSVQYVCEKPGGGLSPAIDLGAPARLVPATAIALDRMGTIHAFFAAEDTSAVDGETPGLRMWMRTSEDGTSFGEPVAIDAKSDGVSDVSSFAAHVDHLRGTIFVFYLTTGRKFAPEVRLLSSADGGKTFASKKIELLPKKDVPPKAQLHLSQEVQSERTLGGSRTIMSWDCFARVTWGGVDPTTNKLAGNFPIEPRPDEKPCRRFRAQGASNGKEFLLTWLEHPVGDRSVPPVLRWQVWFSEGLMPLGYGRVPADPAPAAPAVFANRGRAGFTILF